MGIKEQKEKYEESEKRRIYMRGKFQQKTIELIKEGIQTTFN